MCYAFIMNEYCVALCAINSKYIHSALAPWYLSASLDACGADNIYAEVVEGTINESAQTVLRRILAVKPQAVCIGCYIWNITLVKELLPLLKAADSGLPIILGGPEVSYNAAQILKENPQVDYIISGEGEQPLII